MKKKSFNDLKEEEKKKEKIEMRIDIILVITFIICLIYQSFKGISSGYYWHHDNWFYKFW